MSILNQIKQLVQDPPPEYVIEISEQAVTWAHRSSSPQIAVQPLEPGVLAITPMKDNVLRSELFEKNVRAIVNGGAGKKRKRAALILPDYCARISVIDFDHFPATHEEQETLVRFRVKRFVPFDIESAAVAFQAQQRPGEKRWDVVVVIVGLEIVARYEAPFRAAGYHTGIVTTSAMAAASLIRSSGLTVTAKLDGRAMSVAVLNGDAMRLVRCVELPEVTMDEIMSVLHPTFAFMEDELSHRPEQMYLCGFGPLTEELRQRCQEELATPAELLRSRYGSPSQGNAGLLGYLESLEG
jgi:type IV pilus assembly protein PilM